MGAGLPTYESIGNGTRVSEGGGVSAIITPHANTLAGDLLVAVGYWQYNQFNLHDAGDGWLFKVCNPGGFSGCLAIGICIASRNGSSGYSGWAWETDMTHIIQVHTFRIAQPARFDIGNYVVQPAPDHYSSASSSTTLSTGRFYAPTTGTWIVVLAGGYYNEFSSTTVGAVSGGELTFTERFDETSTGWGNSCTMSEALVYGPRAESGYGADLSTARTNRIGTLLSIPIVGQNITQYWMEPRRYK